jgi:hypothetical protein
MVPIPEPDSVALREAPAPRLEPEPDAVASIEELESVTFLIVDPGPVLTSAVPIPVPPNAETLALMNESVSQASLGPAPIPIDVDPPRALRCPEIIEVTVILDLEQVTPPEFPVDCIKFEPSRTRVTELSSTVNGVAEVALTLVRRIWI